MSNYKSVLFFKFQTIANHANTMTLVFVFKFIDTCQCWVKSESAL